MDKETTILIIAQNGLKTAATLLNAKALKQERQAEKTSDAQARSKLSKKASKTRKLAAILISADEGITAYLREKEKEESGE
jgi:hypothetical protein